MTVAVLSMHWVAPYLGAGWLVFPIATVVLVSKLMLAHFNRIHRLRYQEGDLARALFEFNFWRPLLPRSQYLLLKMGMLAQAELYDSVENLLRDPSLSPMERWNTRFSLCRYQEKWAEAEESLVHAVEETQAAMKTSFLIERAALVAEHFPDRIPEALALYQQALPMAIIPGTQEIMLSYEGRLLTLAGQAKTGLQILNSHTAALEKKTAESYSMLPMLADHRRHLGWALWATGSREEAREMLLLSQSTYNSPRWKRLLEGDLARLRERERLFEEPCPGALEAGSLYLQDYELRTSWPGAVVNDLDGSGPIVSSAET